MHGHDRHLYRSRRADAVKKHLIYGKPLDAVNVIEEIGDLTWYIALVLEAVGSNFGDAFERNIAKLRKRFPDKFTGELALNRDLDAERKALEDSEPIVGTDMLEFLCGKCGRRCYATRQALALGARAITCDSCREL